MRSNEVVSIAQAEDELSTVNIRPGVSVLSVLSHLNYSPWFALAEFVDNSVQSYLANRQHLEDIWGVDFQLQVKIDFDSSAPAKITVRDNAAGIAIDDFPRAFRPAIAPTDRSGLCEFGMGMKSAACWFAPRWTVRTKSIDDFHERTVKFNIDQIVTDSIEELDIVKRDSEPGVHYTEIALETPHHMPVGRTVAKIKEHLTDIYRVFIRNGDLELFFNGELLSYEEPKLLCAPYYKEPDSEEVLWHKEVEFDFGDGLSVRGFAGLRDPGSFSKSGFALFRRGRLIQGSADEGYRPPLIFGGPGSHRSLRLFGELHLEGFEVSHTKDGFRWDENEEPFLELLKEHLNEDGKPLLRQADGYRTLAVKKERKKAAEIAVNNVATTLEDTLPDALPKVVDKPPVETESECLGDCSLLAVREFEIVFRENTWLIRVELTDDPAENQWISVSNHRSEQDHEVLEIRMAVNHPFVINFTQNNSESLEALLRIAAGLALSEKTAQLSGVRYAGSVRRNLNEILFDALAKI